MRKDININREIPFYPDPIYRPPSKPTETLWSLRIDIDINKILKLTQQKILKGTHLSVTINEIKVGYLVSLYFKDIYLYLAQNKLPGNKNGNKKGQSTSIEIYITRFVII